MKMTIINEDGDEEEKDLEDKDIAAYDANSLAVDKLSKSLHHDLRLEVFTDVCRGETEDFTISLLNYGIFEIKISTQKQ